MPPPSMTPLAPDGRFRFACHHRVPCFNECCRDLNQHLTPYDILRLKNHLQMPSHRFLETYTAQHVGPRSGLPVVTLKPADPHGLTCPFVTARGCAVYDHRPGSCRAYPLARAVSRCRQSGRLTEHFALIREPHCRGFEQAETQSAAGWVTSQGLSPYTRMDDRLMDIIGLKNQRLPGPLDFKGRLAFHTALYDLDGFRRAVYEQGRIRVAADPALKEAARSQDEPLLLLGLEWLRATLFGPVAPAADR